ncbi:hypothetical protein GGQ88_004222 [Novosphingobium hassiacum]|uniref:Uncharacterized protein n=1 Tax=Novosphingobium hassiacum TaxID=173676 RepID=A0A7W6A2C3_9SPHN|nr:hypothetical protein [Novosphingobium hassiacum]MBB3862919.1 hypothetical protein [Novosphingobium hassiacum]
MPDMGGANELFDRRIIALVETGEIESLVAMDDQTIVTDGGNGALESRAGSAPWAPRPARTTR